MANAQTISGETRKLRTRAALRAAMLELLGEKPFDHIQIMDLTGRAHVGYATFFRHYQGTEDVLNEIAGDQIRELLAMTIPVMLQFDSSVSLRKVCQYVHDRRDLWRALLAGGAAHAVRAEFVRQARDWARRIDDGSNAFPVDLGTACAAGSTIDALAWWLDRTDTYSVDEIAEFIDQLAITPFVGQRRSVR